MNKTAKVRYTKEEVDYTDRTTDNDKCKTCRHFIPSNSCELVAGEINAQGWCREWERQAAAA